MESAGPILLLHSESLLDAVGEPEAARHTAYS